jgi:hypothetical protein
LLGPRSWSGPNRRKTFTDGDRRAGRLTGVTAPERDAGSHPGEAGYLKPASRSWDVDRGTGPQNGRHGRTQRDWLPDTRQSSRCPAVGPGMCHGWARSFAREAVRYPVPNPWPDANPEVWPRQSGEILIFACD